MVPDRAAVTGRRSAVAMSLAVLAASVPAASRAGGFAAPALDKSVVRLPLEKGISPSLAIQCMNLRANLHNMSKVGTLPLSAQVEAMLGKKQPLTEVFLFCNPITAMEMVAANLDFAAYLPCRITLTEDDKGRYWLVMLDLAPLIATIPAHSSLRPKAEKVKAILDSIMHAGAAGEL